MNRNLMELCYHGASMNPTLRVPDIIAVMPYNGREIHVGDVIVFNVNGHSEQVVHRVTSTLSRRIKTRGDNHAEPDPYDVDIEQVVGRVVFAWRGNRRRRIYGGLMGRLWVFCIAKPFRALRKADRIVSHVLRPLYIWCAKTGIVSRLCSLDARIRVIRIQRPAGTELQLFLGRSLIGRLLPEEKRWCIRRPFRLFVTEEWLSDLSETSATEPTDEQLKARY